MADPASDGLANALNSASKPAIAWIERQRASALDVQRYTRFVGIMKRALPMAAAALLALLPVLPAMRRKGLFGRVQLRLSAQPFVFQGRALSHARGALSLVLAKELLYGFDLRPLLRRARSFRKPCLQHRVVGDESLDDV